MSQDPFIKRHIGTDERGVSEMLRTIGVRSTEELIEQVIPDAIRLKKPLNLPPQGMSEYQFAAHIRAIAGKNKLYRSLIGMGYYGTATPAVIQRNVFENPAWYTSYTPYQAEISQGRLEALLNFQTAVISLTGMEVGNCSLLDEATAAAEAMLMMYALRSREAVQQGRNILFVDENIFPQTFDLLLTRSEPFGIEIVCDSYDGYEFSGREFGAIVQYPAANGAICDYDDFAAAAHSRGVLVAAVADILALALLKAPGEWGADIAVGSTQRFGLPMGFGGPHAAFLTTKDAYKRNMPGRIIGVSVDRLGNKALRMALQTREQHIKRERATSNICTAQALLASMAGFFAVYHGAEGIRRIALHTHGHAAAAAAALEKLGYETAARNFFDTIEVAADADKIRTAALERQMNFFYPDKERVRISFDELSTADEVNAIVALFAKAAGKRAPVVKKIAETADFPKNVLRSSPYLTEPVFQRYRSETDMMRYIKKLERRDISLADGMIPLGSCTMKLNPAVTMLPLSLAGLADLHPFVPADQAEGYRELIDELSKDLATITGMDAVSLQPNSGANGEYSGLMVIRAYYQSRGQGYRNVALIPASAHGTNPASAAMAGMRIVTVACDTNGNIDIDDLRAKAGRYASELCCIMVTYPSTHGVFESRIREIVDIVHDNGGQVYMDGANMNAQVGLTNPGYIGADVCHLNLHKTFASPHGGGGPGVGPICVAEHLVPFLPGHPLFGNPANTVSAAPFGSAGILPITYGYIRMMGTEGLTRATKIAILSANYLAACLKDTYGIVYRGATGFVGHEMILECRKVHEETGISENDIAKRLMDYGYHAPTLSFPVHGTLMIEPTESESLSELDNFINVMLNIWKEIQEVKEGKADKEDNVLINAPHPEYEVVANNWEHSYTREKAVYPIESVRENKFWINVARVDNTLGDRKLLPTCYGCFE